jgi:hypothetical protein
MVARPRKSPERILTLRELLLWLDVSGAVGGALGVGKVTGGGIGRMFAATLVGLVVGFVFAAAMDGWGLYMSRYPARSVPLLRLSYGAAMLGPLACATVAGALTWTLLRVLGW